MSRTNPIITEAAYRPQPSQPIASKPPSNGLRLALLAGFLLWLACPPFKLWPLAWVALAPLVLSVTRAVRLRQAFWRGYVFGWAYLGAVWYWVGLTISGWMQASQTEASPLLGWAAWFGLTLILSLFFGIWGGFAWWLWRKLDGGWRLTGLAAAWVVMEWMRTFGRLTMPWAQLSYTQAHFLPIIQLADITGAYGISFLLMLVNIAAAICWQRRREPESSRWLWATLTASFLILLYGIARMSLPEGGKPFQVAAMQSNFGMTETAESFQQELKTFPDLTAQAAAKQTPPPALYVWSESAAPGDALNTGVTRLALTKLAEDYGAAVIIGSRIADASHRTEANASLLFPPYTARPGRYDKIQLVPFGEFLPLRDLLPSFLDEAYHFFPNDVTPGTSVQPLEYRDRSVGKVSVGPFICYEAMYPGYARTMARNGANLLVTQSNDAWFMSDAAMEQHLAAVIFRAVENRRDVVRSTTNGITCLIDSDGRILQQAPLHKQTFLVGTVRLLAGRTIYTRLGDWFVLCCVFLVVVSLRRNQAMREEARSMVARRSASKAKAGKRVAPDEA